MDMRVLHDLYPWHADATPCGNRVRHQRMRCHTTVCCRRNSRTWLPVWPLGRVVRGWGAVLLLVLLKCREDRLLTVNPPECSDVELEMNAEPTAPSTKPRLR